MSDIETLAKAIQGNTNALLLLATTLGARNATQATTETPDPKPGPAPVQSPGAGGKTAAPKPAPSPKAAAPKPTPAPAPAVEDDGEKPLTKDEVRALIKSVDSREFSLAVLKKYGADTLTALDPKHYPAVARDVEAKLKEMASAEDDSDPTEG